MLQHSPHAMQYNFPGLPEDYEQPEPTSELPCNLINQLKGHEGPVFAVRYTTNGNYCLTCGKVRQAVDAGGGVPPCTCTTTTCSSSSIHASICNVHAHAGPQHLPVEPTESSTGEDIHGSWVRSAGRSSII